jgi:transposase
MAEFGLTVAKGAQNVDRLREQLDRLPPVARTSLNLLFDQLANTDKRIEQLSDEIKETHEQNETSQRPVTIPGVGILSATVIAATTPDVSNFDNARDYAAWLGLTPKPHSTGGKQKNGTVDIFVDCCISAR